MKKVVLAMLACVLALSVVACGDKAGNGGNGAKSPNDAINEGTSEGTEDQTDLSDPQGFLNAYSIGTSARATFTNRSGASYTVSMCVDTVVRGDAALNFINDSMMANDSYWTAMAPDDETQEYIVVKISYTLLACDDSEPQAISSSYAFTGTGEPYPTLLASMYYDNSNGYPHLSSLMVSVGETVEGYEIFQVSKDDPAPVMAYNIKRADLTDGLWFKLY